MELARRNGSLGVGVISSRKSERQLHAIARRYGRHTMPLILRELTQYLLYHEHMGSALDLGGQTLRFDGQISVLIKKTDGVWRVLSIWHRGVGEVSWPVFSWQVVKRGWQEVLARVLIGWRYLCAGMRRGGLDMRM